MEGQAWLQFQGGQQSAESLVIARLSTRVAVGGIA